MSHQRPLCRYSATRWLATQINPSPVFQPEYKAASVSSTTSVSCTRISVILPFTRKTVRWYARCGGSGSRPHGAFADHLNFRGCRNAQCKWAMLLSQLKLASGRETSVVESSILPARITQSYPCGITIYYRWNKVSAPAPDTGAKRPGR